MFICRRIRRYRCLRRIYWKEIVILILFIFVTIYLLDILTDDSAAVDTNLTILNLKKRYRKSNVNRLTTPINGKNKLEYIFVTSKETKADYDNVVVAYRKQRFDRYQAQESQRKGPGERGEALHLEPELHSKAEQLFKKEAFNIIVSDRISLERSVGESRRKECRNMTYQKDLPSASVIIIFHNEAWSPLLRTVYSVVNRSPPHLLHEVVLLDDFSDRPELGHKLESYVKTTWPDNIVRIVRTKTRSGIMRARAAGARAARGEVVVFLDSHCETSTMWLEPLLTRLKESPKSVVCPIIDVIDDKTLAYSHYGGLQLGGFSWSLHFTWVDIPERELKRQKSVTDALRSATMAGGLLAARRDFFFELGGYDEGMDVWGGENLEISFRIWMCGGMLEFIPCSRVGHIFRASHPYTFPGGKDTHGINTLRMANVWMDNYIRFYFAHRPELRTVDYGDVTERKYIRKKLRCKSFRWYLQNVFPEKFVLDENVKGFGQLKNKGMQMCLDMMSQDERLAQIYVGIYPCHTTAAPANQMISLSERGELRREDVCFETQKAGERIVLRPCDSKSKIQLWVQLSDGSLKNVASQLCLDATDLRHSQYVKADHCTGVATQQWVFINHVLRP